MFHHEEGTLGLQNTNDLLQRPVLRLTLEFVEGVRTGDGIEMPVAKGRHPASASTRWTLAKPVFSLATFSMPWEKSTPTTCPSGQPSPAGAGEESPFRCRCRAPSRRSARGADQRGTFWPSPAGRGNGGRRSGRKTSKPVVIGPPCASHGTHSLPRGGVSCRYHAYETLMAKPVRSATTNAILHSCQRNHRPVLRNPRLRTVGGRSVNPRYNKCRHDSIGLSPSDSPCTPSQSPSCPGCRAPSPW